MGFDYRLTAVKVEEMEKVINGEQDFWDLWLESEQNLSEYEELDLDKDGSIAYEVVNIIAELFDYPVLDGFPYSDSIFLDETYNMLKPEKVKELADCLSKLGRKEFEKGFAAADKRGDDYYFTEEGREDFHKWFYQPMIEFYKKTSEQGRGIVMTP
jgi:uncharacterized protein DUF1877